MKFIVVDLDDCEVIFETEEFDEASDYVAKLRKENSYREGDRWIIARYSPSWIKFKNKK